MHCVIVRHVRVNQLPHRISPSNIVVPVSDRLYWILPILSTTSAVDSTTVGKMSGSSRASVLTVRYCVTYQLMTLVGLSELTGSSTGDSTNDVSTGAPRIREESQLPDDVLKRCTCNYDSLSL